MITSLFRRIFNMLLESQFAGPMKPEIKQRWVAALRSGQYKQGPSALRRDDKFCCLGVLCDLAVQDGVASWFTIASGDYTCLDEFELPPIPVRDWAGLSKTSSDILVNRDFVMDGSPVGLAQLNDGELDRTYTFNEIADIIEQQL